MDYITVKHHGSKLSLRKGERKWVMQTIQQACVQVFSQEETIPIMMDVQRFRPVRENQEQVWLEGQLETNKNLLRNAILEIERLKTLLKQNGVTWN